jgi:hypothetical protein
VPRKRKAAESAAFAHDVQVQFPQQVFPVSQLHTQVQLGSSQQQQVSLMVFSRQRVS